MQLALYAIGKMKHGPETTMLEKYLDRCNKAGRQLHLTGLAIREFSESRHSDPWQRREEEGNALLTALSPGADLVALDEKGKTQSSKSFAQFLQHRRDTGAQQIIFAIGGADGHGRNLLARADHTLSLGSMTWPHQLARIMLCEQLYRAMTILSGHPYHRP